MEKHIISKSTFIRGTQCLKSLYLNKKRPFLRDRLSQAQQAIFKRGTDVGLLAQQLFPDGIDCKPRSPSQFRKKAMETLEIIRQNQHPVLYEATFQHKQMLTILDILVRNNHGWQAYEVKSSLKISDTFLLDAAFQYYVITGAGIELDDFFLVTVNPDYIRKEKLDLQQLFTKESVLQKIKELQPYIVSQIEKEKAALQAKSSPKIDIGIHCHDPYPCDFLGHCWKKIPANSLLYLDTFDKKFRFEKYQKGEDRPELIPLKNLNEQQKLQITAALQKSLAVHHEKLNAFFSHPKEEPVFLSLLIIRPAVPLFNGMKPYQHLPVAAVLFDTKEQKYQLELFLPHHDPIQKSLDFFQKISMQYPKVILYDKNQLNGFLEESATEELKQQARKKIKSLQELFQNGTVYHYLIHGDYSPERMANILSLPPAKETDTTKAGMRWIQQLTSGDFPSEELKQTTEGILKNQIGFTQNLYNHLKNKT